MQLCSILYLMYQARCWFNYILKTTLIELQKTRLEEEIDIKNSEAFYWKLKY